MGAEILPEHLLLGIMREAKGPSGRILATARLALPSVRAEIENKLSGRRSSSSQVEIPFSHEAKQILTFAMEEADRLQHQHIGTEHLLLGILREEHSFAGTVLRKAGLELRTARDQVAAFQGGRGPSDHDSSGHPSAAQGPGLYVARRPRGGARGGTANRSLSSWEITGVTRRQLLATVYEISDARIDLPLALDDEDGVYSVVLMMAPGEEGGTLSEPMQAGLARYFRFNVTRQIVSTPALIMTAPDGALRAKRLSEHSGGGVMGISTETIDVMSKGDGPRPISALSGDMSIESLCHALENWLGQPVIDETRIEGTFHIEVRSDVATNEGFLDALRTQTGLALTPGERDVPTLIVRST